ncbi:PX domain protein [Aphelenchoides bicaudatus]|nr:PX domain protein [Aphelenchoides bicaudatus]
MSSSSVLLPDETHCRSELGVILYRDRKSYAFSAEILEITEPASFFGHVDYKVGINMEPVDIHKFESRRFDLVTRFRDINRLYQQLHLIHKQLYLKDSFPSFAETKLFGSTDKETIEERKDAILAFLNFILKNDVLCKARVFQTFIDTGREKSPEAQTSETQEDSQQSSSKPEDKPDEETAKKLIVDDLD